MLLVTVLDQRMHPRLAETAPESGELGGAEMLLAEHQHRMLGKGALDPGKGVVVEAGQIDPERFGAEGLAKRPDLRRTGHGRSSG